MSIICKEMGEITDARSWEERDAEQLAKDAEVDHASANKHDNPKHKNGNQIDVGYKKNKCRLCDRRMKNKISPEALAALTQLHTPGAAVQIVGTPCYSPFL
jgi:twinfilin-like protein